MANEYYHCMKFVSKQALIQFYFAMDVGTEKKWLISYFFRGYLLEKEFLILVPFLE